MEHLDVLVVGAGLSGIGAAAYVERECPWASYAVVEARPSIGGTWDLFRYPGLRSDSDMYTLGYSFRPWVGDDSIVDGASILQYIKDTAAETGVASRIRCNQKVVAAEWSTDQSSWLVTLESSSGSRSQLTCGFLFSCTGYYRYEQGYLPEFPGRERYQGTFIHPQHWPEDLDYDGRRVVVIGSGATAVTLVPAMADKAEHVTMLQRSPTYIASAPRTDPLVKLLRRLLPSRRADTVIRWYKALTTQALYHVSRRWPQVVKRSLLRMVARQLPEGYDVDTHFRPDYNPWDQRFCAVPDGDLFKAISNGSVEVVTDRIRTFTESGIELESGRVLPADIVVSATGLDVLFMGGMQLTVDGEEVDVAHRLAYKGMMLEGVPNMAMGVGYTNASWTLKCELTCDYVCRLLNRMRAEGMTKAEPVNRDPSIEATPLLDLNSGYVVRAADRMPKQGSRHPWRVHQSYLKDYRVMKRGDLVDDQLVLSHPDRAEALAAAS